jgi:hypothetical protein
MLLRAALQPTMERFIYVGPTGRREVRISTTFIDQLVRHPLHDNIRDVSRLLYQAVKESKGDTIRPPTTAMEAALKDTAPTSGPPSTERMGDPTKEELVEALRLAKGEGAAGRGRVGEESACGVSEDGQVWDSEGVGRLGVRRPRPAPQSEGTGGDAVTKRSFTSSASALHQSHRL